MSDNMQQLRICTEKFSHADSHTIKNIRGGGHSADKMSRLQAAFVTAKLWKAGSKIRIGFVYPSGTTGKVQFTDVRQMASSGRPMDPLCDKIKDMKPEDVVKLVVRERIIPIVGLDIDFVDDPSQANVRVAFQPDKGSWAYVGTDHLNFKHPEPTVNFGWIDVPTITHEFGHVLSMIHETHW
jgi:hypothetical protein